MAKRYGTTEEIVGKRVFLDKSTPKKPEAVKRLGKVRHCVFHPTQRRFVGFIVKRPDLLWMFRRKDVFVAYNGYDVVDGRIVVLQKPEATDKGACKALGVNYDDCVLWAGLPVMGEDGTVYGTVGDVSFDPKTGDVRSMKVTQGATANALLGVKEIPGSMIRGFKRGIGTALAVNGQAEEAEPVLGAILVSDEVAELAAEGGLAAKAGGGGGARPRGGAGAGGGRGGGPPPRPPPPPPHGRGGRPGPRNRGGREAGRVHGHEGRRQGRERRGLCHGPPDQAGQRHVLRLQGGIRQGPQGRQLRLAHVGKWDSMPGRASHFGRPGLLQFRHQVIEFVQMRPACRGAPIHWSL